MRMEIRVRGSASSRLNTVWIQKQGRDYAHEQATIKKDTVRVGPEWVLKRICTALWYVSVMGKFMQSDSKVWLNSGRLLLSGFARLPNDYLFDRPPDIGEGQKASRRNICASFNRLGPTRLAACRLSSPAVIIVVCSGAKSLDSRGSWGNRWHKCLASVVPCPYFADTPSHSLLKGE